MLKGIISAIFLAVACTFLYGQQPNMATFLKEGAPVEVIPGMFTTYRSGKHIYWEIPDSLIGREFAVTTTILTAPARPDRDMEKKFGYSGDMIGPVFFSFRKQGDELWIVDPLNERIIENPAGIYAKIAAQRGNSRLYKRLPVKAKTQGSSLIEIGEVLKDFPLFTLDIVSFDLLVGSRLKEKDCIKEIKGYDNRLLVHISRAYRSSSIGMPGKPVSPSYIGDWDTGVCIKLLSKKPLEAVSANSGAYFSIGKECFQGDQPAIRKAVIKRWRLEIKPEDKEKYMKGELVEPIQPIIFYIDRNTPEKYIGCIIEAVRDWRPAFEQAGFKNAIDARLAPTAEEDPDFSIYDSTYPFISWKISGQNNAYGPTPCESRSGEIIACHVGIFSSVLNLEQKWYFAQCGIVDSLARQIEVPDELLGELIKMVVTHEIGHTLGLEHNFIGSSLYSMEQLRDNEFLDKHGMGTSIMDYMRFNYAARGEDRVSLRNRIARIGTYDHFAIEWGYRYAPEGCVKNLDEWVEKEQRNPEKRFVDMIDVRAQSEDLGNDHVDFNGQGIENLKRLMDMPDIWQVTDQQSYRVVKSRFMGVLHQYSTYIDHVLTDIGGVMRSENDTTRFYVPVSKSYMIKVMQFLDQHVLVPFEWLYRDSLATRVDVDARRLAKDLYESTITRLVQKSINIALIEDNVNEEVYSLDEYLDELHHLIFREWRENTTVSASRYMMQSIYVKALKALFGKPDYIPSRVLVKGMKEVERIVEEGNTYMTGLPDVERKKVTWLLENLKSL